MRLEYIELENFKAIESARIALDGKSTVFFGINGTGKSTILRSISLLYANIINQIVNRKELRQSYAIQLEDIQHGKKETKINALIALENEKILYHRGMTRSTGKKEHNIQSLKLIADIFHEKYITDEKQRDIPIFVNYGTNRLVLDIPLRIRTHHTFDIYSAFERAIENKIDFRTFFEWYRNQEDYENERKIQTGNLNFQDRSLNAVRTAILSMLDECANLRVARKPRLEMKIDKGDMSLNVSQMSDGEKCTLALLGDLARRLALANPMKENPLLGEGIVLIDEVELHMHPSWQRKVLYTLKETFPNIQFIVTTHSPIILSEADENYNVFFMNHENDNMNQIEVMKFPQLNGYDMNAVLEQFMETKSVNAKTEKLIHSIYAEIEGGNYKLAMEKICRLSEMTSENHPDVIMARMELRRRMR
ncbi:MAG: AAA family ATPase [Lachnospiraceae bacterium]|nr:AAA family ATPase [Lachnospiraceae bacterium]